MGTRHEGARRSRRRQITHAGTATARARRCRARAHDGYAQAGAWHALAHPILAACNICLFFHTAGSSWNRNIPGHTKNKDQTRKQSILRSESDHTVRKPDNICTHARICRRFRVRTPRRTYMQPKTYRIRRRKYAHKALSHAQHARHALRQLAPACHPVACQQPA